MFLSLGTSLKNWTNGTVHGQLNIQEPKKTVDHLVNIFPLTVDGRNPAPPDKYETL